MRGYGRNFCADELPCFLTSSLKNVFLALFTSLTDIGRSDELQFFKLRKIWKKFVCCCELCALSVQAVCNVGIDVASMRILYSDLAMHLLLSVKHGMVPHLVHGACTAPVIV